MITNDIIITFIFKGESRSSEKINHWPKTLKQMVKMNRRIPWDFQTLFPPLALGSNSSFQFLCQAKHRSTKEDSMAHFLSCQVLLVIRVTDLCKLKTELQLVSSFPKSEFNSRDLHWNHAKFNHHFLNVTHIQFFA